MKRFLMALVVGGALFAVVFGAAAALDVDGGVIQGGGDNTLSCDDAVYVEAWGLNTLAGAYEGVEYARIKGVDGACAGAKLFARVKAGDKYYYSSGSMVGYTWVIIEDPEPEGGYKLYLQDGQPGPLGYPKAEDISEIKIWIEGHPS